jgi:protein TonB
MTTARLPNVEGRTLAIAASIGLHVVLFAASGGRVPRLVTPDRERMTFTVVARPAAPAPEPARAPAPLRPAPVRSPAPAATAQRLGDAPSEPMAAAAPMTADDRVTASEIVPGSASPAPGPSVGAPAGGEAAAAREAGGAGFDAAGYGRGLYGLVAAKKSYPVLARRMGLEGLTRLRVHVRADGSLDGPPEVTSSSGHPLLDREALRMVEAAAPFPAFSASGRSTLTLALTVRFSLDDA